MKRKPLQIKVFVLLFIWSQFSIVECFFTSFIDEFPWLRVNRWRSTGFRAIGCLVFYLIGLSMVTNVRQTEYIKYIYLLFYLL